MKMNIEIFFKILICTQRKHISWFQILDNSQLQILDNNNKWKISKHFFTNNFILCNDENETN